MENFVEQTKSFSLKEFISTEKEKELAEGYEVGMTGAPVQNLEQMLLENQEKAEFVEMALDPTTSDEEFKSLQEKLKGMSVDTLGGTGKSVSIDYPNEKRDVTIIFYDNGDFYVRRDKTGAPMNVPDFRNVSL